MEKHSPVSKPQERLLETELLLPQSDRYMIRWKYGFKNADAETMLQAIREMVTHQQDINSRFHLNKDGLNASHYVGKPDLSRVVLLRHDDGEWKERYGFYRRFPTIWDVPLYEFYVQPLSEDGKAGVAVFAKYHHVAIDGNSAALLGGRIADAYEAVAAGKDVTRLPAVQDNYLQAEQEYAGSEMMAADKAFWDAMIPETEPFPEPVTAGDDGCDVFICDFDSALTERLEAYRKALPQRVSVFRMALSLIGAYLFRRYDSDSVPVMTGTSGRGHFDEITAWSIGMMVNSLMLAIGRRENETFAGLTGRVSDLFRESLRHERYPLDQLTEELVRKGEDTNRLWNFAVVSNAVPEEKDEEYIPEQSILSGIMFRVNICKSDRNGLQTLHILYRRDAFSQQQISFIAEGIKAMAEDIVGNPEKPVDRLTIMGAEEKRLLLSEFQISSCAGSGAALFVERFREAVAAHPDLIALKDDRQTLTYREVDQITDRLAALLTARGEVRGRFVALGIARRNAFALAIYAVMKAGGAYLPLDPEYPLERVRYMLEDSRASLLILDPEGPEDRRSLSVPGVETLDINTLLTEAETLTDAPVPAPPGPDDPAYIIYTSGSTGNPKGVVIPHRGLSSFIAWNIKMYGLDETSRMTLHSSFSFDAAVIALFPILCAGGQLHVLAERVRFDPAAFYQYVVENGITDAFLTTQICVEFLRQYDLPIKNISTGGEKLKTLPNHKGRFYNLYGPTEFTVVSTGHLLDRNREYRDIPIGKPVPGAKHYIVDRNHELVPLGQPGELCLSGLQLAKGYWEKPDLTGSAFVENPFADSPETKLMYRTGDLVSWNEFGEIEFRGRLDGQVKLRGFRVELGEIETAMLNVPGVNEALAVVRGDILVAYFMADDSVQGEDIRASIARLLPEYMVPSTFVRLDALPMTPSGKVDRKKLPAPDLATQAAKEPVNDMQRRIKAIIADVIGNDSFGVDTSLYQAGMSSLSAIRVCAGIAREFGAEINAKDLMKAGTVEGVEALTLQAAPAAEEAPREKRDQYPLSEAQLGVYFDSAKDPASLIYNIPFFLSLSPAVDDERLVRALKTVVQAHPFIKTRLGMSGTALCQLRQDDAEVEVLARQAGDAELEQLKQDFVKPFDLFAGPLYRLAVCRTESRVWLFLDFHHLVFDGFSADVFLNDLIRAYNGQKVDGERISGFDIALEEREPASEQARKNAEAYYSEQLAEVDGSTAIPRDFAESGKAGKEVRVVEATVKRALIDNYCAAAGVTPGSFFLGAAALTISRFVGNRQLLFTTIYSGRDQARCQNTIGMLVKTLPLALTLEPGEKVTEYLSRVQKQMHLSIEHQAVPFSRLATERQWRPEINFAFQDGLITEYRLEDEAITIELPDPNKLDAGPKFPFTVEVNGNADEYLLKVEYDAGLYAQSTMITFADCLGQATAAMTGKDAVSHIGEIGLMTPRQAEAVKRFNDPVRPNVEPNLHGIFEQRAREHPDRTALFAVDQMLTFSELNRAANNLAGALLKHGVEKGDRVAFILGRTSRVFSAMLGIMKAGCAFIPVDPEYPADRVRHILDDSGARFILTHGDSEFDNGLDIDRLLEHDSPENPGLDVNPDDLAYIIYTSGSTGKPKGVMLTHRGVVNYVQPTEANTHVRAILDNNCLLVSIITISFDAFLEDAFCPLMNGLSLAFASEEEANNPDKLAELFERVDGTAADFTPSRLLQYIELPAMAQALGRCHCITVGGEKFPPALFERLRAIAPNALLINSYGPTETTISSNCRALEGTQITIGPPLWNVIEMVVDIDGHPLPPGVVGELWIGGEGVAAGYFGNAEMTADRFVKYNGVRYYRSGDLAKWTEDGDVVILGRNDGQIKLRGLRIELGEIEGALSSVPGVRACAVLVRSIGGREHLCAYYSATRQWEPEELRELLAQSLAKYMVPTAYCQLDSLPQTPSGKTDLKALPEPVLMARRDYKPPKSEHERIFCDIFSSVLELDEVGADDDFFDLGGSSLLVTRVVISALERGFQLSFGDVFTHPTPERLAELVADTTATATIPVGDELAAYDYGAINRVLADNTLGALRTGAMREVGNLVLTGATGFLGIHVLREYLRSETGIVQCLVRGGRIGAKERLKSLLVYYFNDSFDELLDTRVKVVEGDVTDMNAFERLKSRPVDTVINCAANVKHFAAGSEIEDINVKGVENGLAFCRDLGCRYIQISTTSVAGLSIEHSPPDDTRLTEQMLYFGQNLDNKYIRSKFLAERLVLAAAASGEVDGKVMRVGNLMARHEDGEFQINFNTNSFVGALRAYRRIGKISFDALGVSAEFAPIDCTADAILKLSRTSAGCRLFHPYNNHAVFMGDVIAAMARRGIVIEPCEIDEFEKAYSVALRDPVRAGQLSALIAYSNMAGDREASELGSDNAQTTQALLRLGFMWPITTDAYLDAFIDALSGLGFFE